MSIGESMVLNNTLQTSVSEDPGIVSVIMVSICLVTAMGTETGCIEHCHVVTIIQIIVTKT